MFEFGFEFEFEFELDFELDFELMFEFNLAELYYELNFVSSNFLGMKISFW